MYHLESVTTLGDSRSHWVAKGPAGATLEWHAEITDDVPGKSIAWRSVGGASVDNSGSFRFQPAPGGRGTEVYVRLEHSPPGGALGKVVAKLFGYMGAEMCDIKPGDTVAVWGAGPVGQFAVASAFLLGAEKVIAIDRFPYRLEMARAHSGAAIINYEDTDVNEALKEMTGGRGPDSCIEAVDIGSPPRRPAHPGIRQGQAARLETERPHALPQAITCCRSGGGLSVIGVYGDMVDKFPMGAVMNRALTIRSGQCHVHKYMKPLLEHIEAGRIDPTFIITHRLDLDDAPSGYETFKHKEDDCMKVVLSPSHEMATDGGGRRRPRTTILCEFGYSKCRKTPQNDCPLMARWR